MINEQREKNEEIYSIKKLKSVNELEEIFENGFIKLFDECFNVAPYFLKYSDEELWRIYENHFKTGFVLLAYCNDEIIGFAGSRPLSEDEYVADDVKNIFNNIEEYWYHSDIGVSNKHRGKGIAQLLVKHTIKNTPKNKKILMRTKEENIPSINLHKKMGFIELKGVYQTINRKNSLGEDVNDKRIYLVYKN